MYFTAAPTKGVERNVSGYHNILVYMGGNDAGEDVDAIGVIDPGL